MKIGIDIRSLEWLKDMAGLYQYTSNLVANLLSIDSQNEYLLFSSRRGGDGTPQRFLRKFPARLGKLLLEDLAVPLEFVLGKTDVFHGPCFYCPRSLRAKLVVTVHDMMPFRHPEYLRSDWVSSLKRTMEGSSSRADSVIAVSEFTKGEICELFKIREERIRVIYNGVAPIYYPRTDRNQLEIIKKKYGIPGPYFLFVGAIEPKKNIAALIDAWTALRSSTHYQYPLVLVGNKGWYFEKLQKDIHHHLVRKDIICTGSIVSDDLPYLYSGAEAFIMPSLYEGFGIPVIEAMACGTPVITSNRASMPEIAADAALLVDPLSVEDIAGAMQVIASDPTRRDKLVQTGLERAKEFSWEKTARETLSLYQTLGK